MAVALPLNQQTPEFYEPLLAWYRTSARSIIWRHSATSAWGILVSEVMSQQTQVQRVEPLWQAWMHKWPTPLALSNAPKAEILQAWANLGYPRRALRLQECAEAIVTRHDGVVPHDVEQLLALPGIGDYTASAVAAFAFHQRVPVIDTNVRRVLTRVLKGKKLVVSQHTTQADRRSLLALLPTTDAHLVSVAIMELGALVCTTSPQCERCPIRPVCLWQALGAPEPTADEQQRATKRSQPFAGTNRQVRGAIMALLRSNSQPVDPAECYTLGFPEKQVAACILSLLDDGLAAHTDGFLHLPR